MFTGKGGGRYLDHTRWLREDTRLCYARRIADETLFVKWRLVWTGSLVRTGARYSLRGLEPAESAIQGSVDGTSVRDSCDSADEEPGWDGSSVCRTKLAIGSAGGVHSHPGSGGMSLSLRGPSYRSPGRPCELDIRNDQLVAAPTLTTPALKALASGRRVTVQVGTRHPAPGIAYEATRSCSLFPHLYDGIVYLYECDDTLIWGGAVTVTAG